MLQETERRHSVWLVMLQLWHKASFSVAEQDHMLDCLLDSGFSINELDDIYRYEVAPVVWWHSHEALNEQYFCQCAQACHLKRDSQLYRLSCQIGIPLFLAHTSKQWQQLKQQLIRFV
ncbi:DUF7079 family protein [Motilimonas pumila]|uniref:DUF7079 domain-containing protein n=1 Tax=Motilimonas pumila TaxID=2303987 RepID=A0A418YBS0_9GAMM|nr:hypothetical protein [Motilimonas pumila]RJG41943.1 hypothetical protein D1Z90_15745 [Motilimonas pumila]